MPDWTRHVRPRLSSLRLSPTRETEIVEELSQHLDDRWRELMAGGASPDEATQLTLGEFRDGNLLAQYMAPLRQSRLPTPMTPGAPSRFLLSDLWGDLRYAARMLRKQSGFAGAAIVTLALGIGANTAMFAVVNAVLLKPLPFNDPERLMLVHLTVPDRTPGVFRESLWSYPKYQTFLGAQTVFEDTAMFAGRDLNVAGDGEPERVRGEVVTQRYPAVLGINPILGRAFTQDEANREGVARVAMISHGLWTRRFGADPGALGRTIEINATPYTIVGVLPRGFRGLNGDAQVWVPLGTFEPSMLTQAQLHSYTVVARRKADVPEESSVAAVRVLGGQIDAAAADRQGPLGGATAASLYASRADADVRRASFVLLGAVGFVLLIACVNLTNLVGAKAIARRREVAVRVAIGASRGRIYRQFLAEGALLAGFGAAAGLLLAWAMLNAATLLLPESDVFFRTAMAPGAPRTIGAAGLTRIGAAMIGLDAATLLFTSGIAIVTAVLVSLMPALQASSLRPVDALKGGGRSATEQGFHRLGARTTLVTTQIALALVLLAGAGLMVRSAARLSATAIGVTPDRVLTVRIDLPRSSYTSETGTSFFTQLLERVRAIPGVESVGLGNCPPVSGGCASTSLWFPPAGRLEGGKDPQVGIYWATPDYFPTLGIQVLRGRNFTDQDRAGQPKVALVNEAAVRAIWPNDTPIGKTIAVGGGGFDEGAEVIGVVSDVRYRAIDTAATPDVYVPLRQSFQPRMRLFVRSRLDTNSLVQGITREVRALDANLPVSEIKTMSVQLGDAMWRTRVSAWLLTAFAALALLLTAIGIFGVMTQTVVQRTIEIGIRIALGAQRRDVLMLVLGRAALVTVAGLAIGVGSALALTRLIGALLYEVETNDPLTFISVGILLGLVALAACYIPARRATLVDAVVALHAE
jgi:putative ABC transport system permease protein